MTSKQSDDDYLPRISRNPREKDSLRKHEVFDKKSDDLATTRHGNGGDRSWKLEDNPLFSFCLLTSAFSCKRRYSEYGS
jgi:hypothetical protein